MSAAIMIASRRAERRLVEALTHAGATDPAAARPLDDLRGIEARSLRRLLRAKAILEPAPGRYSLDASAYAALRSRRRVLVLAVLALEIAVAAWLAWALLHGKGP